MGCSDFVPVQEAQGEHAALYQFHTSGGGSRSLEFAAQVGLVEALGTAVHRSLQRRLPVPSHAGQHASACFTVR